MSMVEAEGKRKMTEVNKQKMSINKTHLMGIVAIAMVLLIGIASVATAWPPNLPPYDECHVLAIGISDYMGDTEYDDPHGGAVADAGIFYYGLRGYWGMFAPMTLLTDSQATEAGIDAAFASTFNGAGPNDLAIVYWNGHGAINALATWDGHVYLGDKLADKVNAINAGTKIVILDCCHAGGFADTLNLDDTVTLLACRSDERVALYAFSTPWPHFLAYGYAFSHYVNKHPDVNGDGVTSIEEVFGYASPLTTALATQFGDSQHPIMIDNVPGDVAYLDSWG